MRKLLKFEVGVDALVYVNCAHLIELPLLVGVDLAGNVAVASISARPFVRA